MMAVELAFVWQCCWTLEQERIESAGRFFELVAVHQT